MKEVKPDGAGISNLDSFDSNSILNSLDSWVSNLQVIFQAFKHFRLDQDAKTREMLPAAAHYGFAWISNQFFLILDQAAGMNTQTTVEHVTKYCIQRYKKSRVSRKLRCAEHWDPYPWNRDTWLLRLLVQLILSMILVIMLSWHRLGQAISSRHLRLPCLKWKRQVAWRLKPLAMLVTDSRHKTSGLPVTQKETKHWYWRFWIVGSVCQGFFGLRLGVAETGTAVPLCTIVGEAFGHLEYLCSRWFGPCYEQEALSQAGLQVSNFQVEGQVSSLTGKLILRIRLRWARSR